MFSNVLLIPIPFQLAIWIHCMSCLEWNFTILWLLSHFQKHKKEFIYILYFPMGTDFYLQGFRWNSGLANFHTSTSFILPLLYPPIFSLPPTWLFSGSFHLLDYKPQATKNSEVWICMYLALRTAQISAENMLRLCLTVEILQH